MTRRNSRDTHVIDSGIIIRINSQSWTSQPRWRYQPMMRPAIDDFPFVSASRLRALGEIGPEAKTATVRFRRPDSFAVGPFPSPVSERRRLELLRVPPLRPAGADPAAVRGLARAAECCLAARGLRPRILRARADQRRRLRRRPSSSPGWTRPPRRASTRGRAASSTGGHDSKPPTTAASLSPSSMRSTSMRSS